MHLCQYAGEKKNDQYNVNLPKKEAHIPLWIVFYLFLDQLQHWGDCSNTDFGSLRLSRAVECDAFAVGQPSNRWTSCHCTRI